MYSPQVGGTPSVYDPANLLDRIKSEQRLRNDAHLARFLGVNPPLLSKVRNRLLPLGAGLLIRLHEASGKSVSELLMLAGDRRKSYRVGSFVNTDKK
jgi:hypothetical protein